MGMISKEQLESLQRINNKSDHGWRKNQIEKFVPFAQKVLSTAINFEPAKFTNETLTAFIQMFKANCIFSTFEKYYHTQFEDDSLAKEYKIKELFKENIKGYTNAARATVKDLNEENLIEVKQFLKTVADSDNFDEVKKECDIFFNKGLRFMTFGILSPWLYYLKPKWCPIINSPVRNHLKKYGWDGKSYSQAMDICVDLANELKLDDLGYIDSLLYGLNDNDEITQVPTTNESDLKGKSRNAQNTIIYGPPGTGKTYSTKRKAVQVIEGLSDIDIQKIVGEEIDEKFNQYKIDGRIEFVTFHQSYSYEQFVEGISVETDKVDKSIVKYEVREGVFKKISGRAIAIYDDTNVNSETDLKAEVNIETIIKEFIQSNNSRFERRDFFKKSSRPVVLIIDEINRGNISKIFGELITLLEDDKRLGEVNEIIVTLPYSGEQFGVPPNLYIIGTMNTADRSLVQLDTALRRRFDFEEMMPKYREELNKDEKEVWVNFNEKIKVITNGTTIEKDIDLSVFLQNLNNKISEQYDREHQIGHSYLMKVEDMKELQRAWENRIMPLLQEYFYANYEDLAKVIGQDSEYLKKINDKWKLSMKTSEGTVDGQSNFAIQFAKVYEFVKKTKTGDPSENDSSEND